MGELVMKRGRIRNKDFKSVLSRFSKDYAAVVAILFMSIFFSFASPYFLTGQNLKNILLQSSALAIVAMGQALITISGQFDLSLGQNVYLTSAVAAYMMKFFGVNPWIAILAALLLGCIIGLTNGVLFAYFGLPAFVATLGLQMICKSLAKIITNATPISRLPQDIAFIGRGYIGVVPICVIIMIGLYIAMQFITRRTKLGRNIYAIGGGPEAAFFAGIQTKKYYCITFMLGGLLAALGGVILMSRLDSVSVTSGNLYEFDAIIACVVGGLSMTGGKGKIVGAMFGTIFLVMFFNGMSMLNVDPFYQDAIKGVVLVAAITVDVFRNKKRS
ncbi:ABC transporter permease [Oscillospiraceae bacterium PP1C4]